MTTVSGEQPAALEEAEAVLVPPFVTAIESNLLSASDAMQFPLNVAAPLSAWHVMSRPVFTRIKCTKYDAGAVENEKIKYK